jgi:heme A synthase
MCYFQGMFNKLTNFAYTRKPKEALGFYLAYLLLVLIVGGLLGGISGMLLPSQTDTTVSFDAGLKVGTLVAVIISVGLAFTVLAQKKLLDNFGFILLAIIAGFLALVAGALGGLIPVAYLTTQKRRT